MFMKDFIATDAAFSLVEPQAATALDARLLTGIVAGTLVESAAGWHPVERLRIGDRVQTLDGGLARILAIRRGTVSPMAQMALVRLDGGTHDACRDTVLVGEQHVLVDTLDDPQFDGAPYVLVPALALAKPSRFALPGGKSPVEVVTLLFADEEVIFANSGVLIHCPGVMDGAGRYPENSFFPRLDLAAARGFMARRSARLWA